MRTAGLIGRVGGLAVALGVGAALLDGSAVAWADSAENGATPHHSSAGSARSAGSLRSPGPRVRTPVVHRSTPSAASPATVPHSASAGGGRLNSTMTLSAAAPTAPATPSSPATPTDSTLELASLAYSRRDTGGAARSAAVAARSAAAASTTDTTVPLAAQSTGLIMGPSGNPIPSLVYVAQIMELYLKQNSPAGTQPQRVFTPEGLYPITGVKSLPLNTSVSEGVKILRDTLASALNTSDHVTIFGWSQSAIISSLLIRDLDASLPVNFVLVGNEMNPNGGFLSRFPNLTLPSLGIPFYGATPNDGLPVTNYTLEYDGFADFPRYPLNFLADLNAGLGIVFVHTQYNKLTPDQISSAIPLATVNPDTQHYYLIPSEHLPLLAPVRAIPVVGKPVADLLEPALRVLVNLGYGDPAYGWSNDGYANVQTTFGLFPDVAPSVVLDALAKGIAEGIDAFTTDIGPNGSVSQELSSLLTPPHIHVAQLSVDDALTALQNLITHTADRITIATAALYSALLPTADIINALVTTLPAYDAYLFLDGVKQAVNGDVITGLVNAFGMPLAANVGLTTTASLIALLVWAQAITDAIGK